MKGLLIGGGVVLGMVLGFWPGGISRAKPAWWRWLAIVSMLLVVGLALGVPTGGDFIDAIMVSMAHDGSPSLPIYGTVTAATGAEVPGTVTLTDRSGSRRRVVLPEQGNILAGVGTGDAVILEATFQRSDSSFHASRLVAKNPIITYGLAPGLEERARNLFLHVPVAWLSQMAWFVAFWYSIVYLRKRRPEDDVRASSAAALGAVFCILAAVTGAIWAKFNWGEFWNWDPRQISIFVVLVIYGAYFALRSAITNEEQRYRFSSVYLILLLVPVIYFLFIFPRMNGGLHPGASDLAAGGTADASGPSTAGPILSADNTLIDTFKQSVFGLSMFGFSMLFFWMLNVTVRVKLQELAARRTIALRSDSPNAPDPGVAAIDPGIIRLN